MHIYPVIHHHDHALSLQQVRAAKLAGADGAFLISHAGADAQVMSVAAQAKGVWPDFAIGINLLTCSPRVAAIHAQECGLDMIWADDMGVSSRGMNAMGEWLSDFARTNAAIRLFASVAFKYQAEEPDPERAALNAVRAGFIPTTSGRATGSAPDVEKVRRMAVASGDTLAIASGMTPDNVAQYAPYLRHILVATGVALDAYRIDPPRLRQLIWIARSAGARLDGQS